MGHGVTMPQVADQIRDHLNSPEALVVVDVPDGRVWCIDRNALRRIKLRKSHNCAVIDGVVVPPSNIYFGKKL